MKAPTLAEIDAEASAVAMVPRLIDANQIAGLMGVSVRHFLKIVHDGEFARPLRIGSRSLWPASDYVAYVDRLREQRAKRKRHA